MQILTLRTCHSTESKGRTSNPWLLWSTYILDLGPPLAGSGKAYLRELPEGVNKVTMGFGTRGLARKYRPRYGVAP